MICYDIAAGTGNVPPLGSRNSGGATDRNWFGIIIVPPGLGQREVQSVLWHRSSLNLLTMVNGDAI
jgi:hypothetical protein